MEEVEFKDECTIVRVSTIQNVLKLIIESKIELIENNSIRVSVFIHKNIKIKIEKQKLRSVFLFWFYKMIMNFFRDFLKKLKLTSICCLL